MAPLPSSICLPGPQSLFLSTFNASSSNARPSNPMATAMDLQRIEAQTTAKMSIVQSLRMITAELEIQDFCSSMAEAGTNLYHSTDRSSAYYYLDAPSSYDTTPEQSSFSSPISVPLSAAEAEAAEAVITLSDSLVAPPAIHTPSVNPSALLLAKAFDPSDLNLSFNQNHRAAPVVFGDPLRSLRGVNADGFWAQAHHFADDEDGTDHYQEYCPSPSERPTFSATTPEWLPVTLPVPDTITSTTPVKTTIETKEAQVILAALTTSDAIIITTNDPSGLSVSGVSITVNNDGSKNSDSSSNGGLSSNISPVGSPLYRVSYGTGIDTSFASSVTTSFASTTVSTVATVLVTTIPALATSDTVAAAPLTTVSGATSLYGSYWSQEHPPHRSSGYKRDRQAVTDESVKLAKDVDLRQVKKTRRSVVTDATYGNTSNSCKAHPQHVKYDSPAAPVSVRQPFAIVQDTNTRNNLNNSRSNHPANCYTTTTTTNGAVYALSFTHRAQTTGRKPAKENNSSILTKSSTRKASFAQHSKGVKRKFRENNDPQSPTNNKHYRITQ
ncbi:hypothetical protein F5H01DRAFT_417125 [Linnemannia elongata]|nr:hypothetical protein F5H01DRAFT_417125 [Linnemannia elongata]